MTYSKKGWDIVADLIRELGNDGGLLNDKESDNFLLDIANLMDYMINGHSFKSAIKLYFEEGNNMYWLNRFLDRLDIDLKKLIR